jgi:hypothetical protein
MNAATTKVNLRRLPRTKDEAEEAERVVFVRRKRTAEYKMGRHTVLTA